MKAGWQTKTLEEACLFLNGLWKGENPPFVNIGVIRNTNFTKEGTLDDSDIAYLDVEVKKFEKRRLQFGDVILEKSGGGPKQPVGRVILFDKVEGDFSFSNFTSALRVRNPDELDFRFFHKLLYWTYISGITEKMQSHSTGIRNLDGNAYKAITIKFPSLPEQQRIVAILDEAFAGIATATANAEKNLSNARELFENILQSVFAHKGEDWVVKPLGEVCSLITDGKHGDCNNQLNSGYYFLSAKDVKNDTLLFENARQITKSGFEETHRRTNLMPGDICMVNTGATIGRISFAPDDPRTFKTTFQKSVAVIKTIPSLINNHYCCYVLKSDLKKLVRVSSGSAVKNLLLGDLKRHRINLPTSLTEQQAIVQKLDELSEQTQRLEAIYQQKLVALDELKKSILHQAFSDQL